MTQKLSPIYIARQLRQHDLFYFTPYLLRVLFGVEHHQSYRLLAEMKAEQLIVEVEKGKYLLLGLEPERVLSNPLFIASQLTTPAYVSYWSALHFYGFTEQAPMTTFIATTKKKRPVVFQGMEFRFITIQPHKLFGYQRVLAGDLPILIADEAKTFIDCLDQPRYAGGFAEVANALRRALPSLDAATLIAYANQLGDKSLGSRLGYLLGLLGYPAEALIRSASPVRLIADRAERGAFDSHWRVNVNASAAELFSEGVG